MRASIAFIAGLLASGAAVGAARAEAPRRAYDIPAKSLADALIDLGLQARATIGGTPACHGRSRPLVGQYTLTEALDHLLAGSSCRYEMVDACTVRIVRARRWPFLPHPAPVAAAPVAPAEPVPASETEEAIVSPRAAEASRGALESLSRMMVKPEPSSDGTLEGLVREMLRPMLREWLDAHLPEMVEAMVAKEIARITREGR